MKSSNSDKLKFYQETINQLVIDCEHAYRLTIDYDLFDTKIQEIFKNAKSEGIPDWEIWELISNRIPTYINYYNHKTARKKSA